MPYWNRWRRSLVKKNWRWHVALWVRFANWLLGKGFRTEAEYWQHRDQHQRQHFREEERLRGGARQSALSPRLGRGPVFIIQCAICGRQFRRQSGSEELNAHQAGSGLPCEGRHGMLIGIS
jgi:hypothetical protein